MEPYQYDFPLLHIHYSVRTHVNYDEIIQEVRDTDHFASLEWFGHNAKDILKAEMKVLTNRNLEVVTS